VDIRSIIDRELRALCQIEDDDPDYDEDVNLFDAGYLNSLGGVKLMAFLEERFSIEISQRDLILYPMNTLREICAVVERKLER
jgi:D-alanine--poly(phosphoribitol) ligase subunit 2